MHVSVTLGHLVGGSPSGGLALVRRASSTG